MQPLDLEKVMVSVEAVCGKGCRQVRAAITTLEQGADLPETQGLRPAERQEVLIELRAIMAVYGQTRPVG